MQTDAVSTATSFLGGEPASDGTWRFSMGRELYGAFGGVFGGAVAAASLLAARSTAPDRQSVALDCRFVRSLPAGEARAVPSIVHEGRTLSCISIDVLDGRGRIATRATVSLVDPAVLEPLDHAGASVAAPGTGASGGSPWRRPPGVDAPIIDTLEPRLVGRDDRGIATAIRVPWEDSDAGAEAACLVADLCVGPPVAAAFPDRWIPHPNPDLSLRFSSARLDEPVAVGVGRLERIAAGLASVRIEVWSGAELAAVGVSSSLLLPGGPSA
jgi:acyl-coenzyme A thioesterase PaaI-like protein